MESTYNISLRNISILIEEDSRGGGYNEIVGMQSIKAYENDLSDKNLYLNRAIDDGIDRMIQTDYFEIEKAFYIMSKYFDRMKKQEINKISINFIHQFIKLLIESSL